MGGVSLRLSTAALAVLAANAALAQPRPSTTAMSCAQAHVLVASRGAIVLSTGPHTYDRFVAHAGFCQYDETTEPAFERAADNPQCFVGYRCRSRWSDRIRR
jgi:hypothetical protein